MSDTTTGASSATEREHMHANYRQGGEDRKMAPHVVYADSGCPWEGCTQQMHAIDFRLEEFGRVVHDPLVTAWWNDTGFAGCCPACGGWIHFSIRAKTAVTAEQADQLPQLPANWFSKAMIL